MRSHFHPSALKSTSLSGVQWGLIPSEYKEHSATGLALCFLLRESDPSLHRSMLQTMIPIARYRNVIYGNGHLDQNILRCLQDMLQRVNPYCETFKMAS